MTALQTCFWVAHNKSDNFDDFVGKHLSLTLLLGMLTGFVCRCAGGDTVVQSPGGVAADPVRDSCGPLELRLYVCRTTHHKVSFAFSVFLFILRLRRIGSHGLDLPLVIPVHLLAVLKCHRDFIVDTLCFGDLCFGDKPVVCVCHLGRAVVTGGLTCTFHHRPLSL